MCDGVAAALRVAITGRDAAGRVVPPEQQVSAISRELEKAEQVIKRSLAEQAEEERRAPLAVLAAHPLTKAAADARIDAYVAQQQRPRETAAQCTARLAKANDPMLVRLYQALIDAPDVAKAAAPPEARHPEALAEVEALARQMREANPKLTKQQAYKRALEQHPRPTRSISARGEGLNWSRLSQTRPSGGANGAYRVSHRAVALGGLRGGDHAISACSVMSAGVRAVAAEPVAAAAVGCCQRVGAADHRDQPEGGGR